MKRALILGMFCLSITMHAQLRERDKDESFVFGVQGDSHPERKGKMFSADLYRVNMQNVISADPDFYVLMGDDSNIDRFVINNNASQQAIDQVFAHQKSFTDLLKCPVLPVVGNHEQIAGYLLDGSPDNVAVYSALARKKYFPVPESFSGNTKSFPHAGVLKDYYAFEHGNALFVIIDPYWHSEVVVDNKPGDKPGQKEKSAQNIKSAKEQGGGKSGKNPWGATLGKEQYDWLVRTLSESTATHKFVFAHHVNGSGRGGVECAGLYEWGGYGRNGVWEFDKMRPGWEMPIHKLFVKYGVDVFFQGHDHLFCKQELDGVIYQSCPNPADNTYTAFNANGYRSGDVLPNSGFLRVSVKKDQVEVAYVRAFLEGDGSNGEVAYRYIVK